MRNQCYLSTKRRLQKYLLCLAADYKQNFENETIVNRTMDYDETKDQQNFERLPLGMNWIHSLRNVDRHYVDEQATW